MFFSNIYTKDWHLCPYFRGKMLAQHSFIKDNKIHVEIEGDHGIGSFKLSYQIANVSHPNSTNNTVVFSIFEAKSYRSNIKTGFTKFREQINALQTMN